MTYLLGVDVGGTFTDLLLQCLNNFQPHPHRLPRVILMGVWIAEVNQQSIH